MASKERLARMCAASAVEAIMAEALLLTPDEFRAQLAERLHGPIQAALFTYAVMTHVPRPYRNVPRPSDN